MSDKIKEHPCEICGGTEFIAGVASSFLGAISFNHCSICLAMTAQPKWLVEFTVENCGGLENVHPDLELIYFDKENDVYKSLRSGEEVPIELKDGRKLRTKQEYLDFVEKELKKQKDQEESEE
jgi:hypothetical protein